MNTNPKTRILLALGGAALLCGVGTMASAEDTPLESDDVQVKLAIAPLSTGALTLTVDGTQAALAEVASSDPALRQFAGELPDVTVTDTRDIDDIDPGAAWYVLGSATDFEDDGQALADIPVERLGWAPRLADSVDFGSVSEGDPVFTVYDTDEAPDNTGLVDQELFAIASNSADIRPEGSWTATADLVLKTPVGTAPGSYTSRLTLSLFE
jgi:hypothetical protein